MGYDIIISARITKYMDESNYTLNGSVLDLFPKGVCAMEQNKVLTRGNYICNWMQSVDLILSFQYSGKKRNQNQMGTVKKRNVSIFFKGM